MIDLNDKSVVDWLHKAGWRMMPDNCMLVEADVLSKLIFNNVDASDREWALQLLEDIASSMHEVALRGLGNDGTEEHDWKLDQGDGQPPDQFD